MIVDDHSVIRHGVRAIFERHRDIEITGEAASEEEAAALCSASACDVALVDLRLGAGSGVNVVGMLREFVPTCRAVMLTGYGTEREVCEAVQAGAFGCILKTADAAEIVAAVRAAHAGHRYFSAAVAELLAEWRFTVPLTTREQQVLELLVPGNRNRSIADALGLTEETIKGHVKRIFGKLGVRDRTEAVTKAIRQGLVRVD
ncbi:MAG TPA: response regulator transcription factor [Thermoanaerobaculia bacterium]|nr:response regulator transcription factor [Thermoanaerobaculia bacterium]